MENEIRGGERSLVAEKIILEGIMNMLGLKKRGGKYFSFLESSVGKQKACSRWPWRREEKEKGSHY